MRKMRVSLVVAMVVLFGFGLQLAIAQTEVSGNIIHDKTWTVEGSPYIVVGSIILYPEITLTIEPGVNIKFNDSLHLAIYGELIARGTVTDSIIFTSNNATPQPGDWDYIDFQDASVDAVLDSDGNYVSGCVLEYCRIEYGTGIGCYNASPFISHSTITGNSARGRGSAIYCDCQSSPIISNNTITGNSSPWGGGGISCGGSSHPTISKNTIIGNSTGKGGGIYCYRSYPIITGNTIMGNSAYDGDGGGIYCYDCFFIITGNTITGNFGGGIYCCQQQLSPTISHNVITGNSSPHNGGGIYCNDHSSPTISNNTITGNYSRDDGGGICCDTSSSPIISNNTITGNSAGDHGGGIHCCNSSPTITGNTITGNSANGKGNGIYCRRESNPTINYNNLVNGDQYEVCLDNVSDDIDATNNWWGTTNIDSIDAKIWDYYDNMALGKVLYNPFLTAPYEGIGEGTNDLIPIGFFLSQNYPNPFNPVTEIRYTLPRDCQVRLEVYSILGQRVAMLVEGKQTAGYKSVRWDASGMASGIYFYRLQAGEFVETRKMVVIK